MEPVHLAPNLIQRFYRGGSAIARFRGDDTIAGADTPEDWLASTTCVHGGDTLGLSTLPDGRLLREAVTADPVGYLGAAHVAEHGADPALLVKLLDAGERLPVHCHPDRAFAKRHLGLPYGKTEAWLVIGAGATGGTVYLGFKTVVPADRLSQWVTEQDIDALLGAMHEVQVAPGDAWLVPAGVPHAIGQGLLIVELQEPTDLSVLLEWRDFAIDGSVDGHLGLGFEVALQAVDRSECVPPELGALHRGRDGSGRVLPEAADPFFAVDWLAPTKAVTMPASFAVLICVDGQGTLHTAAGPLSLGRGDTVLVPHGAGNCTLEGDVEIIRCRPPARRGT